MHSRNLFPCLIAAAFLALALAACQPAPEAPGNVPPTSLPSTGESPDGTPPAANGQPEVTPGDPQALWAASLHGNSYVVDEAGMNSTCARCHAPINYIPAPDAMPASCGACKFEVEPPPPTIAKVDWQHIPCKTCHQVKKGEVQAEYTWLAIPIMEEYEKVASTTDLCIKCHTDADAVDHAGIAVAGAHADYTCTRCHEPHSLAASCDAAGCHPGLENPPAPIPGHDADHAQVSCEACHDAGGLDVGPDEQGQWVTLRPGTSTPWVSHNTVKEAPCERCHFPNNPWKLSEAVSGSAP